LLLNLTLFPCQTSQIGLGILTNQMMNNIFFKSPEKVKKHLLLIKNKKKRGKDF
jgi:hypothetical protein